MTEAALMAAIHAAQCPTDQGEGILISELIAATSTCGNTLRPIIAKMLKAGTARRAKRMVERIDGRWTPVTSYVLIPKPKAKR